MTRKLPLSIVFSSLLLGSLSSYASTPSYDLLLSGGNIVDVTTGQVTPDGMIAINDDKIVFVGKKTTQPMVTAVREIKLNNKYVIPGLWDIYGRSVAVKALVRLSCSLATRLVS